MKFNDGVDPENVLLAYYTSISFAFTEICGRRYGGGVLEILPGEMGNILLPKVERIDPALSDKLLAHIDAIVPVSYTHLPSAPTQSRAPT